MADGKFTILGETSSGKTCYLLGMYYKMRSGVGGYTISIDEISKGDKLVTQFNNLKNSELGEKRFPETTTEKTNFNLELQYNLNTIKNFNWVDYPGGFLVPGGRDVTDAQYKEVENSINHSDVLFICIDGANLVEGDLEDKIDEVINQSAVNITPYLTNLNNQLKNQGKTLPPIAMIVTKYDLCKPTTSDSDIKEIIEESFRPLFGDNGSHNTDTYITIIPVSLGAKIKDDGYRGKLKPINVHLPILFGVQVSLERELAQLRQDARNALSKNPQIANEIENYRSKIRSYRQDINTRRRWIDENNDKIRKERDSFFFVDKDKIYNLENSNSHQLDEIHRTEREIDKLEIKIKNLEEQFSKNNSNMAQGSKIDTLQNYLNLINNQLTGLTMIFKNGAWQN